MDLCKIEERVYEMNMDDVRDKLVTRGVNKFLVEDMEEEIAREWLCDFFYWDAVEYE